MLGLHFSVRTEKYEKSRRGEPFRLGSPTGTLPRNGTKGFHPFGIPGEAFILTLCVVWGRKSSFWGDISVFLVGAGFPLPKAFS